MPIDSYQNSGLKAIALEVMHIAQVYGVLNYSCIFDMPLLHYSYIFSTAARFLFSSKIQRSVQNITPNKKNQAEYKNYNFLKSRLLNTHGYNIV